LALALALALAATAMSSTACHAFSSEAQQMCKDDAFRLVAIRIFDRIVHRLAAQSLRWLRMIAARRRVTLNKTAAAIDQPVWTRTGAA
jgi:hypothetical protein